MRGLGSLNNIDSIYKNENELCRFIKLFNDPSLAVSPNSNLWIVASALQFMVYNLMDLHTKFENCASLMILI